MFFIILTGIFIISFLLFSLFPSFFEFPFNLRPVIVSCYHKVTAYYSYEEFNKRKRNRNCIRKRNNKCKRKNRNSLDSQCYTPQKTEQNLSNHHKKALEEYNRLKKEFYDNTNKSVVYNEEYDEINKHTRNRNCIRKRKKRNSQFHTQKKTEQNLSNHHKKAFKSVVYNEEYDDSFEYVAIGGQLGFVNYMTGEQVTRASDFIRFNRIYNKMIYGW